jgi:hypothetical protein
MLPCACRWRLVSLHDGEETCSELADSGDRLQLMQPAISFAGGCRPGGSNALRELISSEFTRSVQRKFKFPLILVLKNLTCLKFRTFCTSIHVRQAA